MNFGIKFHVAIFEMMKKVALDDFSKNTAIQKLYSPEMLKNLKMHSICELLTDVKYICITFLNWFKIKLSFLLNIESHK